MTIKIPALYVLDFDLDQASETLLSEWMQHADNGKTFLDIAAFNTYVSRNSRSSEEVRAACRSTLELIQTAIDNPLKQIEFEDDMLDELYLE